MTGKIVKLFYWFYLESFFFILYFISKSFRDSTAFGVNGIKAIILKTVINPTPISPRSQTKV